MGLGPTACEMKDGRSNRVKDASSRAKGNSPKVTAYRLKSRPHAMKKSHV
jgi:hypothetical protein